MQVLTLVLEKYGNPDIVNRHKQVGIPYILDLFFLFLSAIW